MNNNYADYSKMLKKVNSKVKDKNNPTIPSGWSNSNPRLRKLKSKQICKLNKFLEKVKILYLLSNSVQINKKIISRKDLMRKEKNVRENKRKRYNNGRIGYRRRNSIIRALSLSFKPEWTLWIQNSRSKYKQ